MKIKLDARIPSGDLRDKWSKCQFETKLVNPANKRKFEVIVVGTGLAGASAAASLSELGYRVKSFCIQDSPRRAHSIAAQGGINASKNYQNDGDSIWRLFHDTIKGGDYRSREANVYRLAEVSGKIIDHCVAQGIPFAREYGGMLDNRSFGGSQVSRTFYARGQTGQQLLLGAYSAMMKEVSRGNIELFTRHEMLDLVVVDGAARGIITRNLKTGEIKSHLAHAVLLCTGGYGNMFYLSTNAMASNVTATYRAYRRGAGFANPCFTQIHPTCIPISGHHQSKLTLMSESLRNDGRVWVPLKPKDRRAPNDIPESERDYYLERKYPSFGNLVPRDVASRNSKQVCDEGRGVGSTQLSVYLDFQGAVDRLGQTAISQKYGNLFQMYEKITGENPYQTPMRIYPAIHYTMGGLWVDYHLMSNVEGLFVLGEANFSDHGANRLGASALMQGLADGYFVIPTTLGGYLTNKNFKEITKNHSDFKDAEAGVKEKIDHFLNLKGEEPVESFHRRLGKIMWDYCGMSRNAAGLKKALKEIKQLKEEFKHNAIVTGEAKNINISLEKAGRISDFIEFGEMMIMDALERKESCGGHFREESQTKENEAKRDDKNFAHVSVWFDPPKSKGKSKGKPSLVKEKLKFQNVKPTNRSYK